MYHRAEYDDEVLILRRGTRSRDMIPTPCLSEMFTVGAIVHALVIIIKYVLMTEIV